MRLQDAPASITSISDDTLRAANLDSANDLARAVPSLTITDAGPGQRRITLRGIRSAGDAQVGIYYDETPVAGPPGTTSDPGGSQSDFKLFDLERVEVLRGPQGTLYGAGAVGGTIRLVTRKPDFEFGGKIDVGATTTEGGGEGYQINAAVNVPIVKDVLAVRGVYFRRQNDGWVDNPGLGLTGINSERSDGGRILVRFIPASWLTIDGAAHFLYTEGGASTWSPSAGKYNAVNASQVPYEDKQRLYSLTGYAHLLVETLGPQDTARQAELTRLDAAVADHTRYDGARYGLVEDSLQSALLARGLERPRSEVEGRFAMASRIADEVGHDPQRLRIAYNRAWTAYWWFNDPRDLSIHYDATAVLALESENAADLELLLNLWQVVSTADRLASLRLDDALCLRCVVIFKQIDDGDIGAFSRIERCDCPADPAVRAGDDGYLPCKATRPGIARLPFGLGRELALMARQSILVDHLCGVAHQLSPSSKEPIDGSRVLPAMIGRSHPAVGKA